jgi:hypothetical protein
VLESSRTEVRLFFGGVQSYGIFLLSNLGLKKLVFLGQKKGFEIFSNFFTEYLGTKQLVNIS